MHQGIGQLSVLNSVFYNNSAGSDNVEDGEVSARCTQRVHKKKCFRLHYLWESYQCICILAAYQR